MLFYTESACSNPQIEIEFGMMITRPQDIAHFRQKAQLSALKLEIHGLTRRGQSAYAMIKAEYGLKGNKQKVYNQFEEIVNNNQPK